MPNFDDLNPSPDFEAYTWNNKARVFSIENHDFHLLQQHHDL